MKSLYKLHFDCGRAGTIRSIFITNSEELQKLVDSKCSVYFGEYLGKHSEIYGPIEECDYTLITQDQDFIKKCEQLKLPIGPNPVDYWVEWLYDNGKNEEYGYENIK